MKEHSQNGYAAIKSSDSPYLHKWVIPGTGRHLYLRRGSLGLVLAHYALYHHEKVENLRTEDPTWDDWGWAYRAVRGQTSGLSNHASGTAMDLNATQHPLGTDERQNFTAEQIEAIRDRLEARSMGGVIRWGGDYAGRQDPMHFEVADLSRVPFRKVEKIARGLIDTPRGKRVLDANPGQRKVVLS
jgi:hypothetical protein